MEPLELLRFTPLLTAALWLGIVVYRVARDRYRSWAELLLLATCLALAGYAAADAAFLNAPDAAFAEDAIRVSFTFRTLLAASFLLLGAVLYGRMRRTYGLLAVPSALALVLVWSGLVVGVVPAPGGAWPYDATYDALAYGLWLGFALACVVAGLALLTATLAQIRRLAPRLGRRMRLELSAAAGAVLLGEAILLLGPAFGLALPPLLSTLLAIPGVAAFAAMSPGRETPFLEAADRWKARDYRVRAALLTDAEGVLLGSAVRPGAPAVDGVFYSSALEVIQDFLRTSFASLQGRWLRSLVHGGTTFVLERGRTACLTLVLEGKENDQLRRRMRDALLSYEAANHAAFERGYVVASELRGTDALLSSFLGPAR